MKQTTGVFAVLTAALFLGSTAGVGCGGDDDTTGGGGKGGSGGSTGATGGMGGKAGSGGSGGSGGATGGSGGSTAGSGGTAGSAGAAGKGGSAGMDAGGSDAPTTMTCGTRTCSPVMSMLGTWAPCCPMGEMDACGGIVNLGTIQNVCVTATFGLADSSCPSVMLLGQTLLGCCRPNGRCGNSAAGVGLGCADPTPFGGTSGNMLCGGDAGRPPDGSPGDTGPSDTGPSDTGPSDTGPGDTGAGDTSPGDTGDSGRGDTGTSDGRGDAPTG
jgi:hypothetical protein